ncbi:alpha/beta hydrolase fold domain-containing protein [Nocardia salmonicida]|uniref:alpha/beta hydrolase n=1 Tax=Nocardia salmonicida TaxID=53431 RepID=UPI0034390886
MVRTNNDNPTIPDETTTPAETTAQVSARTDFPGGSLRSRAVAILLRILIKPAIRLWVRFPAVRWPYALVDWAGRPLTSAPGMVRTAVSLPNCAAISTRPAHVEPQRFVLYLHGGGFLVGGTHLHRQMTSRFAADLDAEVLAVTYRKLPRHSIATSIADSLDGYRYALSQGIPPEKITLMGDSAGGYLVVMTAIEIRERGLPMPAAIVAMSPLTNWDMADKLAAPTAQSCAVFPSTSMPAFRMRAALTDPAVPLLSPVDCDLSGLPPILIQVGSAETFYPDAVLLAERLAAHGASHELQVWHDQVHVFQAAAAITPEAEAAVEEIRRFVARAVGSDETLIA